MSPGVGSGTLSSAAVGGRSERGQRSAVRHVSPGRRDGKGGFRGGCWCPWLRGPPSWRLTQGRWPACTRLVLQDEGPRLRDPLALRLGGGAHGASLGGRGRVEGQWAAFPSVLHRVVNHLIDLEVFPEFIGYIFKFFKLFRLARSVLCMLLSIVNFQEREYGICIDSQSCFPAVF